jgi:hypothetical protein
MHALSKLAIIHLTIKHVEQQVWTNTLITLNAEYIYIARALPQVVKHKCDYSHHLD